METSKTAQVDYSIVICTYNPEREVFRRCLRAVARLNYEGLTAETIVVDNNSNPALNEAGLRTVAPGIPGLRLLRETRPGVVQARITAIRASRGRTIVYFDDDNEPESDYLQAHRLLEPQFPQVGAWGPGHVTVEYTDGIDPRLTPFATSAFQERHETATRFDNQLEWQDCYPFGTGMCIQREILLRYLDMADAGSVTLEGRSARKLTSGEDTQMVLVGIRNGYAAGVSPVLRLRHLIPARKANAAYLKRLAYGTSVCYEMCLLQVFPEREAILDSRIMTPAKFNRKSFKRWAAAGFGLHPSKTFELARYIGFHEGIYIAAGRPVPAFVNWVTRLLRFR